MSLLLDQPSSQLANGKKSATTEKVTWGFRSHLDDRFGVQNAKSHFLNIGKMSGSQVLMQAVLVMESQKMVLMQCQF
jgi:hypothetical protein